MHSLLLIGLLLGGWVMTARAQTPPPWVPQQSDRPQPGAGEEPGFVPIFDGVSLAGWDGDPTYWRVEDDAIVGEVTPETLLTSNSFLVWRDGEPADFELRLQYRISGQGNSGINYRSVRLPAAEAAGNAFALRGYQCDLDGRHRYTGNNYEERGRLFLAVRGQMTRVTGARPPVILANLATEEDLGAALTSGWNDVHLLARGPVLIHVINGRVMSVVMDDDAAGRSERGRIGVQVHVGPPMKVEFRRIRLKVDR